MRTRDIDSIERQVTQMREALEVAKTQLLQQRDTIGTLTSLPLGYATVVAINGQRKFKPTQLDIPGTKVRYADHNRDDRKVLGTVVELHPEDKSYVKVKQSDGYVENFRIKDLEVAETITSATATIIADGKFLEVFVPVKAKVNPGDTVRVTTQTMQIIDVAPVQMPGNIAYVRRIIDKMFAEVDYESHVRVVFNGKFSDSLEKGDRVVLDSTATVVVRNLGKEDERFSFTAETNVTWNDIGGLAEAKQQMIEAVELPHKNPAIFKFYRKKPVKGVLLYGPPGCGKTMLGKATATALAAIYKNGSRSTGFIYIKGPEILDRFVGVAEATIRQIFQRARKHKETHGYPAVIFIDEADAILAKRGSGVSSDVERTIVPMFLTEMDGLEDSGALVILATNRPDILDPAVVRDGRIDRKVKITRPTPASAVDIFKLNLKEVPLYNGYTRLELAKLGSRELFSPKRVLYQVNAKDKTLDFTLGHIVNGGMVAGVVEQATSIALQRDLSKRGRKKGLCKEDLVAAVDVVEQQNRDLNHNEELSDFVHDFREDVVSINRLRQGKA